MQTVNSDNETYDRAVEPTKRVSVKRIIIGLLLFSFLPIVAFLMTLPLNTIESAFNGMRRVDIQHTILATSIVPFLALLAWFVRIRADMATEKNPSKPLIYLPLLAIPAMVAMGISENLLAFNYEIQKHKPELMEICRQAEGQSGATTPISIGPFRIIRIDCLKGGGTFFMTSDSDLSIDGLVFMPNGVKFALEDLTELYPKRRRFLYLHQIDENWYVVCDGYRFGKRGWS